MRETLVGCFGAIHYKCFVPDKRMFLVRRMTLTCLLRSKDEHTNSRVVASLNGLSLQITSWVSTEIEI